MKPYYQDLHDTLYNVDFRMNDLPSESVQMVCTSPPYWGLRRYSGEQELIWGDNHCEHSWGKDLVRSRTGWEATPDGQRQFKPAESDAYSSKSSFCSLCGAWKGAYGLEPTPELYIEHTIEILREIRRVLRKDGVVFWNIGDSYASNGIYIEKYKQTHPEHQDFHTKHSERYDNRKGYRGGSIKAKDLCLIPFRVAISAQEDGWWVRSVIIWSKPNPMPESVTDRPTESHEYILMLTKSKKYYWDADAVREPLPESSIRRYEHAVKTNEQFDPARHKNIDGVQSPMEVLTRAAANVLASGGRNIRSVWEFPTQPYPEAHFAVFPEKLPERCLKAATPEVGCCGKCGAPWERITEASYTKRATRYPTEKYSGTDEGKPNPGDFMGNKNVETLGWQPTCKCKDADKVPSVVLDPFAGAGTTLWVAKKLNRKAVGYEISEEYCQLAVERNRQQVLI